MSKFTPGPWKVCNAGDCVCKTVWCPEHPVAQITSGDWGDDYPTLEIEGGSLQRIAKPVMAQITYGNVPEEIAKANALLIASAPDLYAEHKKWAHDFGVAIVLYLQGDSSAMDDLARTMKLDYAANCIPALKSDAIDKADGK